MVVDTTVKDVVASVAASPEVAFDLLVEQLRCLPDLSIESLSRPTSFYVRRNGRLLFWVTMERAFEEEADYAESEARAAADAQALDLKEMPVTLVRSRSLATSKAEGVIRDWMSEAFNSRVIGSIVDKPVMVPYRPREDEGQATSADNTSEPLAPQPLSGQPQVAYGSWNIDTLINTRMQLWALQPMASSDPALSESIRRQIITIEQQLRSIGITPPPLR